MTPQWHAELVDVCRLLYSREISDTERALLQILWPLATGATMLSSRLNSPQLRSRLLGIYKCQLHRGREP